MTTPFEASTRAGHTAEPSLSTLQTNTLRLALLNGREQQTAAFTHHADTLVRRTADSCDDTTGRDRAMAALHMYVAREAIEEIQDALLRIRNGEYGTCQSCGLPISLARLEVFPWTRCCTACSAASTRASRAEKTRDSWISG
jgi:RNA polymerase-binding transcription factor DksA